MAAVYPYSIKIEYYNGTSWTDISAYVVSDIRTFIGFVTDNPIDRVAGMGTAQIILNNEGMLFTPYGGDSFIGLPTMTGFNRGAQIRITVYITSGMSHLIWTGRIESVKSDDGTWGRRQAVVDCVDWMAVPARFPMVGTDIETNVHIGTAMTEALASLSVQPEDTDFDTGDNLFTAAFSDIQPKTRAISEFNKLALSELGYIYVKQDGTLRVEAFSARSGVDTPDIVPLHPSVLDTLLLNDGDDFILNDGDLLLLSESATADVDTSAETLTIELDNDVINSAFVRAYPTRTATSLEVVFSLGTPISIAPGRTVRFSAHYINPSGGLPISATNLQTPVSTTDYLMNASSDGSGTDLTASLTITATYYGDSVAYVLTNTNTVTGYVTKLQARGYGIYFDAPIEAEISDATSVAEHGDVSIEFDQKYKNNFYAGSGYATGIVELHKTPRSRIKAAKFLANGDGYRFMASVYLDIGGLVDIYDNRSGLTRRYYIFSKTMSITQGKIISVVLGLIEFVSILGGGLSPVSVEFDSAGTDAHDAIEYGTLPQLDNLSTLSISAWVYPYTYNGQGHGYVIINKQSTAVGWRLGMRPTTGKIDFLQMGTSDFGEWLSPDSSLTINAWNHIVITRDSSNKANQPVMYINGSSVAVTEDNSQASNTAADTNIAVQVGNVKNTSVDYANAFSGKIADVRVYNRILTAAEALELYNAGRYGDAVPSGLLFQSQTVDSTIGDATSLAGAVIPTGHLYLDNMFHMAGTVNGTPKIATY